MTFQILTSSPNHKDHPSFITVYKPIAGWKAVQYWWNDKDKELGGFWEPWQTGSFAYDTKEKAIIDATMWAEAEDIPLYVSSTDSGN